MKGMINTEKGKGRRSDLKFRFICPAALAGCRSYVSPFGNTTTLLSLLLPAFFFVLSLYGCRRVEIPGPGDETPAVTVDSTLNCFRFSTVRDGIDIDRVTILVYSRDGLQELDTLIRSSVLPDGLDLMLPAGDKYVVAIANSRTLSNAAVARYGFLDQLSYNYEDDRDDFPIMGGRTATSGASCEVVLSPLLCHVELSAISNTLDDYELLEEPRVRLVDINASALLFGEDPVFPTEYLDAGEWASLPYDVGYYTQYPGIMLDCYPNGTPENTLGSLHTALEFEATVLGERCSYEVTLPPFSRGDTLKVELTVNGKRDFSSKVTKCTLQ